MNTRDAVLRKTLTEMGEDIEKILEGFAYCISLIDGTDAETTHWSALSSAAAAAQEEDDEEDEGEDLVDINMI